MDVHKLDLASLIAATSSIAAEAKTTFGHLNPSQLNWKPSPERWSVAQCFHHLLTTNNGYFPAIDNVLAGKKRTFWEGMPLLPALGGKLIMKAVEPTSTRKFKAPKAFQPAQSDVSGSVINDFVDQQAKIIEKMKSTEHLDVEKIVITSPVTAVMTYSLMDAYRIIVVHEQRHFQQAKRVMEEAAFPA
jgi:DinB superfamily